MQKRLITALLFTLGFSSIIAQSELSSTQLAARDWVKSNAIPITSLTAESGLDDLEPVKNLVGNAKILALGEATHGTSEFFKLKHRMLEYLVKKQGFTVFAIEGSWASAFEINRYVMGGEGNARDLLAKYARLMWPWRVTEVLDLIEWMKIYNAREDTTVKVQFTGFDMQEPVAAVDWLTDYFERAGSDQVTRVDELLTCIRFSLTNILAVSRYSNAGLEAALKCQTNIATVKKILNNRRKSLEPKLGSLEFLEALQMQRMLEQGSAYYLSRFITGDLFDAVVMRDEFMAQNVAWLAKNSGANAKLVLWAHNGHVTFNPEMSLGWKPMGARLKDRFGSSYKVFGFSFYTGDFYAQLLDSSDPARTLAAAVLGLAANPSINRVPTPVTDSYETVFHATGIEMFILGTQPGDDTSNGAKWLQGPHRLYLVPQNLPPFKTPPPNWISYDSRIGNDFDAVIYVDQTHPSTPL
jgi:erythromycin esterase